MRSAEGQQEPQESQRTSEEAPGNGTDAPNAAEAVRGAARGHDAGASLRHVPEAVQVADDERDDVREVRSQALTGPGERTRISNVRADES